MPWGQKVGPHSTAPGTAGQEVGRGCWWLSVAIGADCVTDLAVASPMAAPADGTMRK